MSRKILIIMPRWSEGSLWGVMGIKFPYLSLTTLAALTPPDIEVRITDENVEAIDFDSRPDLVAVSLLTPLAPRGYEIADRFRTRGVPVVVGGMHATMMPEEAEEHADAVVVGEGEILWPEVVADFIKGELKKYYLTDRRAPLASMALPRRDLLRRGAYLFQNTLQTTRGCPNDCDFCSVTTFYGNTYRFRPVAEVLREIEALKGNLIFFVDDNIIGSRAYAQELFEGLKPLKKRWVSQATLNISREEKLLTLARDSGCLGLFVGFESLSQEILNGLGKPFYRVAQYEAAIRRLHDYGIGIQGSFIFGNDNDPPDVFSRVVRFCNRNRLEAVLFSLLTPFPGTRIFHQLLKENRILHFDWEKYDMNHVVFRPRGMEPEALEKGFFEAYKQVYSGASLMKRLFKSGKSLFLFGPMNLSMRRAWKRIRRREGRIRA
jgi:radical SAM superfamily enzyme YgiQ (UPF0313 family)